MFNLRDFVVFLAGAEFFHTLSHVMIIYMGILPMDLKIVTLTADMNLWAIIINALLTLLLLWWAKRLGKS